MSYFAAVGRLYDTIRYDRRV